MITVIRSPLYKLLLYERPADFPAAQSVYDRNDAQFRIEGGTFVGDGGRHGCYPP